MAVYLCDDEPIWLGRMEQAVSDYLVGSDWDLSIALCASSPSALLAHLKEHTPMGGIYFLDMIYSTEVNGMELGQGIRRLDPYAALIYVTTHDEMMHETFRLKLQALDYILKDEDDLYSQIHQCLNHLEQACLSQSAASDRIVLQAGGSRHFLLKDEIYYISAVKGSHKIQIHTQNELHTFPVTLSSLEQQLSGAFLACSRGILVNPVHVAATDGRARELVLDNGEKCPCSTRMWRRVMEELNAHSSTAAPT